VKLSKLAIASSSVALMLVLSTGCSSKTDDKQLVLQNQGGPTLKPQGRDAAGGGKAWPASKGPVSKD
jgi:hypothetical protein